MATLLELALLPQDAGFANLKEKIKAATMIKAAAIIDGVVPNSGLLTWAQDAMRNPEAASNILIPYVLATNGAATVAAIVGASDSAIQTNINAAVDALYTSV